MRIDRFAFSILAVRKGLARVHGLVWIGLVQVALIVLWGVGMMMR